MRKMQGYKLPRLSDKPGLAIDFDKDPTSKRNKQYERQRAEAEAAAQTAYVCSVCGAMLFRIAHMRVLQDMPQRRTDKARCVEEKKLLRDLCACKGGHAAAHPGCGANSHRASELGGRSRRAPQANWRC